MTESVPTAGMGSASENLYNVNWGDPHGQLVDRSAFDDASVSQITRVMNALSSLRDAELEVAEASERFMKLKAPEMRALHFLIIAKNQNELVTPSILAAHLDISAASTTKLLNKLEEGGHIVRKLHPQDRRVIEIHITPHTERSAVEKVGKLQARRFHAAARLTSEERETVIRFLEDMAAEISLSNAPWAQEQN